MPAAIYATDAEGRITYFNEAAAAMWGVRPELGKSEFCGSWKLYHPDGKPMAHGECPMAVAIREQREVRGGEAIAERPDGTRIPFRAYPTPIYDAAGNFNGALNMLVDISDRQQFAETSARLAAIVQSSDDAIVSKNLHGIVQSWNAGAERLFGYTADEIIGQSITILIPPDRIDEEPGIIARIRAGERVDHYETIRRRKDGTLVDVSITVSPVRDAIGNIVGASKIARDITEKKRADAQQRLLLAEMRHRVKNTLATVQAIAMQTMRSALPEDRAAFDGRLRSLASAHDLLGYDSWSRAGVTGIVDTAIAPFREKVHERIRIAGTKGLDLDSNRALLLSMALHELATNAMKYGALSNATGTVDIIWTYAPAKDEGERGKLTFIWREQGGPPVKEPTRKGFGSLLLQRALADLGKVDLKFAPEGVVCTLDIRL